VVIKEPKATLLHGVWFEAARLAGFDIQDVIVMRHPQEAIASFAGAPSSLARALECLAVFALSLHHLQPALAARVFAEGTRAANKLLIIDLHVWRRSRGAMACTFARFTAR
jgi:hypothetical protein